MRITVNSRAPPARWPIVYRAHDGPVPAWQSNQDCANQATVQTSPTTATETVSTAKRRRRTFDIALPPMKRAAVTTFIPATTATHTSPIARRRSAGAIALILLYHLAWPRGPVFFPPAFGSPHRRIARQAIPYRALRDDRYLWHVSLGLSAGGVRELIDGKKNRRQECSPIPRRASSRSSPKGRAPRASQSKNWPAWSSPLDVI